MVAVPMMTMALMAVMIMVVVMIVGMGGMIVAVMVVALMIVALMIVSGVIARPMRLMVVTALPAHVRALPLKKAGILRHPAILAGTLVRRNRR